VAAAAPSVLDFLLFLFGGLFSLFLSFLEQGFAVPHNNAAGGILYLHHGVVHVGIQHRQVLIVGHNGLLERCQDVLEVVLGLGADILQPAFRLFVTLLQFHLLFETTKLQSVEAALSIGGVTLIITLEGRIDDRSVTPSTHQKAEESRTREHDAKSERKRGQKSAFFFST